MIITNIIILLLKNLILKETFKNFQDESNNIYYYICRSKKLAFNLILFGKTILLNFVHF